MSACLIKAFRCGRNWFQRILPRTKRRQRGKLAFRVGSIAGQQNRGVMGGDSFGPSLPRTASEEDYFGDDFEQFGSTSGLMETSSQRPSWIEPDDLKLMHRIGRGLFGDVWLATLHNSTEEFDEFHEVAVKMMPLIADDRVRILLAKFEALFEAAQGLNRVSWPQGISTKNGKACIIMKFYEGSIGDKIAKLPGNALPIKDVVRYGVDLVRGIMELHSCGVLALNLKPCNYLLDEQDTAVLGEFGIPLLFFENSATKSEPVPWMGTPNYMAPEQWDPALRGPLSFETDAWGFACSIVEMISGVKPWANLTANEILEAVVVKREKPAIPAGLPPGLHHILRACFEYDYRRRPTFAEILRAFTRPDELFQEGDWICVRDKPGGDCTKIGIVKAVIGPDSLYLQLCDKLGEPVQISGGDRLSLWKDKFRTGERVKLKNSVSSPRFGWAGVPQVSHDKEALVVGLNDNDGVVVVSFRGSKELWKADPVEIERVSGGLVAGDWVFLRGGWAVDPDAAAADQRTSRIGVIHHVASDGKVQVAFLGRECLWTGSPPEFEKAVPLSSGQFIRLRNDVLSPRFQWPVKVPGNWDMGRIVNVLPNGGLMVDFPGRFRNRKGWWADAEEVEVVRIQEIEGIVQKYQHIESMHWAIRPVVSLLGFLIVARAGIVVVNVMTHPFQGKQVPKEEPARKIETKAVIDSHCVTKEPHNTSSSPLAAVATLIFGDSSSNGR
ncbi:hypothetical protein MPTK1_7g16990 [Marchantia polymorpha subsp. ruderalis]|uniref:Protein kinase domain-containing protein n=2 Tax=Marchantia polymorpha TaxID=3197 RepID=A0AAF6C0L9_MARPO|nr:hypothetical protein MARPO_0051s0037 [Marchantia polymorpha]BBN17803.1 hypothetical protein Mp_7g16990 [Marchantia polymorpha subsp. ruderalis]|eukprot:PTQ38431.1 hypothetical protein MARPO_0051s0037 [Marchantia polymorpha]